MKHTLFLIFPISCKILCKIVKLLILFCFFYRKQNCSNFKVKREILPGRSQLIKEFLGGGQDKFCNQEK